MKKRPLKYLVAHIWIVQRFAGRWRFTRNMYFSTKLPPGLRYRQEFRLKLLLAVKFNEHFCFAFFQDKVPKVLRCSHSWVRLKCFSGVYWNGYCFCCWNLLLCKVVLNIVVMDGWHTLQSRLFVTLNYGLLFSSLWSHVLWGEVSKCYLAYNTLSDNLTNLIVLERWGLRSRKSYSIPFLIFIVIYALLEDK